MHLKNASFPLPLIAWALLPGGCATKALWEEVRFARFHEPASPATLRLAYSNRAQDVLVEYDESCEEKTFIKRRADFLYDNRQRIETRRKPRFVRPARAVGFEPIRVLESPRAITAPAAAGIHAVVSTDNQSFTLYTNEMSLGSFDLPVYTDASRKTKQVLLTPVTVTTDLTIVGGYLFLLAWSTGQLYWVH